MHERTRNHKRGCGPSGSDNEEGRTLDEMDAFASTLDEALRPRDDIESLREAHKAVGELLNSAASAAEEPERKRLEQEAIVAMIEAVTCPLFSEKQAEQWRAGLAVWRDRYNGK